MRMNKKLFELYITFPLVFITIFTFLTFEIFFLFIPTFKLFIDWVFNQDCAHDIRLITRVATGSLMGIPIGLFFFLGKQDEILNIKERSQERAWATVVANNNLISIETIIGIWKFGFWSDYLLDLEGKQFYLKPNSPDEELGEAVITALSASKKISIEDAKDYVEDKKFLPLLKEHEKQVLEKFGYENRHDMQEDVLYCLISVKNDLITMQCMQIQEGKKPKKYNIIHTPLTSPPSKIGAALRAALSATQPLPSGAMP